MNNGIFDKNITPKPENSLADEPREFIHDSKARFAPADNLYDAIRSDVMAAGGGFEFRPLERHFGRLPPFNDIDEPNDDE